MVPQACRLQNDKLMGVGVLQVLRLGMEYRQDRELKENFKLVEVGSGLKQEFMGLRSRSKVWIGT